MLASGQYWRGFGLIEILVTMGVLFVGIVGVTVLHANMTRQGLENKSRGEALGIAQSRIEDMRNYTGAAGSQSEFDALFANTAGFTNSATIIGTNAVFTRSEQIGADGAMKALTVRVTWAGPGDATQSISLDTRLGYVAPGGAGDAAAGQLVEAPTGRAHLGAGELPWNALTTSNGDGTARLRHEADLLLVAEGRIALTLPKACRAGEEMCTDFARIKGRVWIDQESRDDLRPGDVYVVASDAGFCARHYTVNGVTRPVTQTTSDTIGTGTGSYEYFDYTCYVGGGWHGSIGIQLAGGSRTSQDKICVGDPVTTDATAMPFIAVRRIYRGLLYKYDAATGSGKEEIDDGDGGTTIRYYSQGIADGAELPAPNSGQQTHDFVIGAFQQSPGEGTPCKTQGLMTRADAVIDGVAGALFSGMPTDFVCLNDGYLDAYDTELYGHGSTCPHAP